MPRRLTGIANQHKPHPKGGAFFPSKESPLKGKVVLAVSFLPKELMTELEELLEDVVLGGGNRL